MRALAVAVEAPAARWAAAIAGPAAHGPGRVAEAGTRTALSVELDVPIHNGVLLQEGRRAPSCDCLYPVGPLPAHTEAVSDSLLHHAQH